MANLETSDDFERTIDKLDNSLKLHLDKLIKKIISNPLIGKPMRYNRKDTREVYLGSFRLSYMYDENSDTLFLLEFYHKDAQ